VSEREGSRWLRPMRAREPAEAHRASTPLELFFDLCFVVAVSLAAAGLHHALAEQHIAAGVLGYLMVFFAIWWAWVNFTAFASAYDTDDAVYRVTTLVQITGALVLAAGVPDALARRDFHVITYGYVIMRLAMVGQWLRAARSDPPRRACALRFASGVTLVQLGWVLRLGLPGGWGLFGFAVLVALELAVPVWAERAGPTTWHPEHLGERYALFTLIVLGEVVLASTSSIQQALFSPPAPLAVPGAPGEHVGALLGLAGAGTVIVFSLWWLYFDEPAPRRLRSVPVVLSWAYGHYPVFASVAAVGAGLEVAIDSDTGHTELGRLAAGWATALPVAVYVVMVWLLRVRGAPGGPLLDVPFPLVAASVLASPWSGAPVQVTAALLAVLVVVTAVVKRRRSGP
jgi:low temperature requirement protein LtrA